MYRSVAAVAAGPASRMEPSVQVGQPRAAKALHVVRDPGSSDSSVHVVNHSPSNWLVLILQQKREHAGVATPLVDYRVSADPLADRSRGCCRLCRHLPQLQSGGSRNSPVVLLLRAATLSLCLCILYNGCRRLRKPLRRPQNSNSSSPSLA
jgi:hypothetical protein